MRLAAKLGLAVAFLAAAYLAVLLVIGWVAGGVVADQVQARLAGSFDAEVRVGGADVSLLTGTVVVRELALARDQVDHLGLTVKRVDVDVAPLGWVLIDRTPRRVRVEGARLVITGAGALALPPRPAAPPVTVGGLELEDAVIDLMATGYWPGLARMVITIERARTGPTTLRTGLSWLFALEELVARVELPAGLTVHVAYRDGRLAASGGFFGATPVTIDFRLPPLDGPNEAAQLLALGKELGKQLALERARRWIEQVAPKPAAPPPATLAPPATPPAPATP